MYPLIQLIQLDYIWIHSLRDNPCPCPYLIFANFVYTTAIWGQEILHLKVRKFATKLNVKFFTLCNFYTVCKAIFRVPIWLTTSGCNGRNKYQVWMWNEIFISLSCGSKNPIGHPTTQEFILMGDFLKNFSFWTFLTQRGPVGFIPLTLCLFFQNSVEKLNV